jgi:hypothetical protein
MPATQVNQESAAAAVAVLDRSIATFSPSDFGGILACCNYPHVRFHSGKLAVFPTPEGSNLDFYRSTSDATEWARSVWNERRMVHSVDDTVHLDIRFSRLRADGSAINAYRSIHLS